MHVDHWGMGGRGNEITASRTEHSGVLRKGLCSSKEGVSLSLLTNTLKKTKAKQPLWLSNHVTTFTLLMVCTEEQE